MRQSRTTLRSSSDSARRGHDDLIVGRDRDLRDLLVSTAAKATEPALEQEAAGARADALDRRREAAVGALRAGILDCVGKQVGRRRRARGGRADALFKAAARRGLAAARGLFNGCREISDRCAASYFPFFVLATFLVSPVLPRQDV